jgi:hypothetical protein
MAILIFGAKRACKLKPPAKFSYEATRFFIAEKLLSFFLFTAIRRSSTQLKFSLNPNLLSIQALWPKLDFFQMCGQKSVFGPPQIIFMLK